VPSTAFLESPTHRPTLNNTLQEVPHELSRSSQSDTSLPLVRAEIQLNFITSARVVNIGYGCGSDQAKNEQAPRTPPEFETEFQPSAASSVREKS